MSLHLVHIHSAINFPVGTLPGRLDKIPCDLPIAVYGRSGNRNATPAQIHIYVKYQPVNDLGGIQTWIIQRNPVEN